MVRYLTIHFQNPSKQDWVQIGLDKKNVILNVICIIETPNENATFYTGIK